MPQHFADVLADALERAHILRVDFAKKVGTSPGFITDVMKERRTPPIDRIPAWSDVLGLKGSERERFLELAVITHIPTEARPHFLKILQRLDKLEALAQSLSRGEGKRDR